MKTLSRFVTEFTSLIVAVLSCLDRVILARESSADDSRPGSAATSAARPAAEPAFGKAEG